MTVESSSPLIEGCLNKVSPALRQSALEEIERRRNRKATYTKPLEGWTSERKMMLREFYRNFHSDEKIAFYQRQRELYPAVDDYYRRLCRDTTKPYQVDVSSNSNKKESQQVSPEDFWQRYEYRCCNIERVAKELLSREQRTEELSTKTERTPRTGSMRYDATIARLNIRDPLPTPPFSEVASITVSSTASTVSLATSSSHASNVWSDIQLDVQKRAEHRQKYMRQAEEETELLWTEETRSDIQGNAHGRVDERQQNVGQAEQEAELLWKEEELRVKTSTPAHAVVDARSTTAWAEVVAVKEGKEIVEDSDSWHSTHSTIPASTQVQPATPSETPGPNNSCFAYHQKTIAVSSHEEPKSLFGGGGERVESIKEAAGRSSNEENVSNTKKWQVFEERIQAMVENKPPRNSDPKEMIPNNFPGANANDNDTLSSSINESIEDSCARNSKATKDQTDAAYRIFSEEPQEKDTCECNLSCSLM